MQKTDARKSCLKLFEFSVSKTFMVPCYFVSRDKNLREKSIPKVELLALDQNRININDPSEKTQYTRENVLIETDGILV